MKFLIACALFAVAVAADVKVVHLPAAPAPEVHQVDMRPLIVPQAFFDAVKVADAAINRDAEIDDSLKVKFVDAAVETDEQDLTVRFVDAPEVSAVQFVDAAPVEDTYSLEETVADDSLKVHFVDAPVQDEIEAVKIAQPVLPFVEVPSVDAVKVAYFDDARYPSKVYADPRLR